LENWELEAYYAIQQMVECFFDRKKYPFQIHFTQTVKIKPVVWRILGKYLWWQSNLSAYQILNDPKQKDCIDEVGG